MKKVIKCLIFILVFLPITVFAKGNITVAPASLTIEVGSTKNFTITAVNAIGDVTIASSNTSVAKVNKSTWETGMVEEGATKSGTITVTGVSEGTATITITIDGATFDSEDLSGQKRTISVSVIPKKEYVKSDNNKLKELKIDGYDVTKVSDNKYTLVVDNEISSVNIKAILEDSKAKVIGSGNHNLKDGLNTIELIITAENGSENRVVVEITRNSKASLENIDKVLSDNTENEINIVIDNSTKVTKDELNSIKNSGKIINLNYYDDNKNLLYSWILNGKEIDNIVEFDSNLLFTVNNYQELNKNANFANGVILNFAHSGNLPKNTKIKIFVGDKFSDGDLTNVYNYKDNEFTLEKDNIEVKNGYVEFDIDHCSIYFVTLANLITASKCDIPTESNQSFLVIFLSLALTVLIIFNVWYFLIKKRRY